MDADKYSCLVVDDEPIARKIIVNYIAQIPFLKLHGESINALAAIDELKAHPEINIIFLDINMPNLSGLQLLKIIQPKQPVILTTAYSEYAVESYELNAVDYLLKPFSFQRFTKAVYKAVDVIKKSSGNNIKFTEEKKNQLFIKSDGKNYPVYVDEIVYCEAMKNYTMVMLNSGQKLMPLIPLSKFEIILSEAGGDFLQVHRSFIISRKHIANISATSVMLGKFEVPIGIQFREKFFKAIGMKGE